jgi:hypothetical protein
MADYKTSLLVNRQVPEFIREENPVFITFLEAYYEYLETKQGTQLNDLTKRAKEIRNLSDVDDSIEEFEESFFNMYASLVPRDVAADKALLIKNVLPLYLSKGSENSFKLLFRLLFGNEVQVTYPRSEVLRASDGKWLLERYVKVNDEAFILHTGNGTTKEFNLPVVTGTGISVYLNGVLQTNGYFVRREIQKLYFNTAPANGVEIKVAFTNFEFEVAKTRKLTGTTSGANAIVERVGSQVLNNKLIHEFYIDENTLDGEFAIGELITADIFDIDGEILDIYFRGLSSVVAINVIDGGSSYIVGDPVPLNSPNATEQPKAIISKVFSGAINKVNVLDGGAGFKVPKPIFATGYTAAELEFAIQSVFANGANSVASSFFIYSDVISDVDPANTVLSVTDWHFPGNVAGQTNVNTVISRALSNSAFTSIGSISNVAIISSNVILSVVPDLYAEPADITLVPLTANTTSNTVVKIDTYGSIGKLIINDGGGGYAVGDELIFTNPPNKMAFGVGAYGEVVDVDGTGKIKNVLLLPPKLTGTVNVYSLSNTTIQGNNTTFLSDLAIGDFITIRTGNTGISSWETRKVVAVDSNTSFNVNTAFSTSFIEQRKIRKYGINPVGGQNYKPDRLPLVTVSSDVGANANISAYCILGDGELLEGRGTKRPGEIERISIIDPGAGITIIPQIDLSGFGDGTATANVELSPTYDSLPGRWTSSDGILSSDRKLQGRNFYVNYSYLTSSFIEFSKYKKIFKELLHPAGFKAYAEWETFNTLPQSEVTTNTIVAPTTIRSLSGTVNVNGSIVVVGSGTKFNVANTMGILTIGSYIAVNSEIRMINAIISNTVFTVSNAFSITANTQELVVINTAYTAVATEVTLDEIIAENELVLTVES